MPLRAMSKAEIFAHQHHARVQPIHQNLLDKFFRREAGQLFGERKNNHFVDTESAHQGRPLVWRGEQTRGTIGGDQAHGMRIESNGRGDTATLVRQGHDPQLERAIKETLAALEKNPPKKPSPPDYTDRTR